MMAQATAIKARPFLCTAEEMRGILGGGVAQIRRPIFPKHIAWAKGCGPKDFDTIGSFRPNRQGVLSAWLANYPGVSVGEAACPHGGPGDQLWVRETWFHMPEDWVVYKADPGSEGFEGTPWRSPRHMPRWAARILLEIAAIRIERPEEKGPWMWAIEVRRIEP